MFLLALALAAGDPYPSGSPTPAPPPPPLVASDPAIRAMIEQAHQCVTADRSRFAAAQAVEKLKGPIGSAEWEAARMVVADHVAKREEARRCLNDLERARYGARMSPQDRHIVADAERGLVSFWLHQGDYEASILARLVGISKDAGHYPVHMHR